jgi:hypothetical protein
MNTCYVELDIKIHPLKESINSINLDTFLENQMTQVRDISELNNELVDFLHSCKISIRPKWLLIYWFGDKVTFPHTDGFRNTALNWNFTPGSWVEFYEKIPGNDYIRSQDTTNIFWKTSSEPIAIWDSLGPALINTQIPHTVKNINQSVRRLTYSIGFDEPYFSVKEKLKDYLKK